MLAPAPTRAISVLKLRWLALLLLLCLAGCSGGSTETGNSHEIVVFAASSLTDAFDELADAFMAQHEGVDVVLNYAGSSQLAAQLVEGVPADLFAPANETQMARVVATGRITANSATPFVSNRLTIIVPADNPAGITQLADLAQPGVQLILAAEGVPVRQYTDEIIARQPATFQTAFYANLVSAEENVRQVAAKIALGEADAGIVYRSDVTPDLAARVEQIAIPAEQNVIAAYPIAPLADASEPALAQTFIDFVLSPEGQAILAKWGFEPPPAGP
ncbi:MAG: molybdate ABC transporter substrate-binding protein [Ardenticatenales bacterium]|nr:molybdate ABC transporter substrate-binding protein [Ardenticatenales bacterium]